MSDTQARESTDRFSFRLPEGVEFAHNALDRLSPDGLTRKQLQEQAEYIDQLKAQLESQRVVYLEKLRQVKADYASRLVADLLSAAFEEAHGGVSPQSRHRLAITSRTTNTIPVDIENALDAARRKAEKAGRGQTPVTFLAQLGPVNERGAAPVRRILMVADVSDVLPADD